MLTRGRVPRTLQRLGPVIDGIGKKKSNGWPRRRSLRNRRLHEEHSAAVIFLRNAHDPAVQRQPRLHCVTQILQLRNLVLISLVAASCIFAKQVSAQIQESDTGHNSVHGTVINAVTHDPIGRALVYSADNRFATLTDSEGHFEFAWPAGGAGSPSWLSARKPGFLDDPSENRQVEASPGTELTISLMPEALIRGRVTLSAGDGASGINLQIFSRQVRDGMARWVQGASVRANSNGEFRFADLPPGAYKLLTNELMDNDPIVTPPGGQLYGFPPVYYPSATDFAAASTIQLTAGQTFQADLSPVRQPYYPVRIPVANAVLNGGINITVSPQGHRGPGYSLGYNPEKQRIEGSLPNGDYLVEASTFAQNSATGAVNLAVAGSLAEGPSMTLVRDGSLNVNVKEEFTSTDGNPSLSRSNGHGTFTFHGPRTYLNVSLETADDFEPRRGRFSREPARPNNDSLVIESLPPGRYWLRLSTSRGYVAAASMGSIDLLHQPLVVGPGSSTPIEITMRDDGAEIEGTVSGVAVEAPPTNGTANGRLWTPPAWVYCVPLPDSPGQFQQLGISPSDGKFSSQTMAPGTYRVMAFKSRQPNLPYRDAEAMRAYDSKGQVVHLSSGQKATVQLQIVPGSE